MIIVSDKVTVCYANQPQFGLCMEVCVEQELNGKVQTLHTHLCVLRMISVCLQLTGIKIYFINSTVIRMCFVLVY